MTCASLVVISWHSAFLHQQNWPPRHYRTIVDRGDQMKSKTKTSLSEQFQIPTENMMRSWKCCPHVFNKSKYNTKINLNQIDHLPCIPRVIVDYQVNSPIHNQTAYETCTLYSIAEHYISNNRKSQYWIVRLKI